MPEQNLQQQWVGDVIQTAKDQDIWRDLAIGMIDEIGAIKVVLILATFILGTIAATVLGVLRFLRKKP